MPTDKETQKINDELEAIFLAGKKALLNLHHKKMARINELREVQENEEAADILKKIKEL